MNRAFACLLRGQPALPDLHGNTIITKIRKAIDTAEKFHTDTLGDYYHPKTYSIYCVDKKLATFGSCRWVINDEYSSVVKSTIEQAIYVANPEAAADERYVRLKEGALVLFKHSVQDEPGDGTVSRVSGAAPEGKVLQSFLIKGFDHQSCFKNDAIKLLTLQLIVKLMQ